MPSLCTCKCARHQLGGGLHVCAIHRKPIFNDPHHTDMLSLNSRPVEESQSTSL